MSHDEVNLLYLARSLKNESMKEKELFDSFMTQVVDPTGVEQRVTVLDEIYGPPTEEEHILCLAKKYKPVALKIRPVLGELPDRYRI